MSFLWISTVDIQIKSILLLVFDLKLHFAFRLPTNLAHCHLIALLIFHFLMDLILLVQIELQVLGSVRLHALCFRLNEWGLRGFINLWVVMFYNAFLRLLLWKISLGAGSPGAFSVAIFRLHDLIIVLIGADFSTDVFLQIRKQVVVLVSLILSQLCLFYIIDIKKELDATQDWKFHRSFDQSFFPLVEGHLQFS